MGAQLRNGGYAGFVLLVGSLELAGLRTGGGIRRHMGLWYRRGIEVLWTHVLAEQTC